MRKVRFVPAEQRAREQNPTVQMMVHTAPSPYRGNAEGRRPLTVPEAEKSAGAKGWVRLSSLPEREQDRWREAYRKAKAA